MWLSRTKSVSVENICPSKETLIDEESRPTKTDTKLVKEPNENDKPVDKPLADIIFAALIEKFAKVSLLESDEVSTSSKSPIEGPCDFNLEETEEVTGEGGSSSEGMSKKIDNTDENNQKAQLVKSSILSISKSKQPKINKSKSRLRLKASQTTVISFPVEGTATDDSEDFFDEMEGPSVEETLKKNWRDIFEATGGDEKIIDIIWENDNIQLEFYNGNKFLGKMRNSLREGEGTYTWTDGTTYNGNYYNDLPNGFGEIKWNSFARYQGSFVNGERHGQGSVFQDTSSYTGDWVEGKKHGKGKIVYTDHSTYEGDFVNCEREGYGLRSYESGSKYLGSWKNGLRHGHGIMLWSNNDMYIGNWKQGTMDGYGKYIWKTFSNEQFVYPLHNCFIGQWKDGIRNGLGTLILSTGAVVSTVWQNGIKHGPGKVLCTNGTTIEAHPLFIKDNIVGMYKVANLSEDDINMMNSCEEWNKTINSQSVLDLTEENLENSSVRHFRACVIPLNMPPYFMNLDYHLEKLFNVEDWDERISFKEEFSWDLPGIKTESNLSKCIENEKFFSSLEEISFGNTQPIIQIKRVTCETPDTSEGTLDETIEENKLNYSTDNKSELCKLKNNPMLQDMKAVKFRHDYESLIHGNIFEKSLFYDVYESTASKLIEEKEDFKKVASYNAKNKGGNYKSVKPKVPTKKPVKKGSDMPNILYRRHKSVNIEGSIKGLIMPELKIEKTGDGMMDVMLKKKSNTDNQLDSCDEHTPTSHNTSHNSKSFLIKQNQFGGMQNVNQSLSEDFFMKIYSYEKKWLRNTIINHTADLNLLYRRYSTICCKEQPDFEVGMLRIMLWKLLKDCGLNEAGFTIVELDKIAVKQSDPFDYIPMSEMIHYLLILSWELFTKKKKINKDIPGVLGGGFDLYLKSRVYPACKKHAVYGELIPDFEDVPLEATYKLFLSLGPNLTIDSLLKRIFRKDKTITFDDGNGVISLPKTYGYFLKALTGNNIILPGGEIMYKRPVPTLGLFEKPESYPESIESLDIDIFSILGHDLVLDATISACIPTKNAVSEELINKDMELSFLEFIHVLTNLIHEYIKVIPSEEEKLSEMSSPVEVVELQDKKSFEECLDSLINRAKEKLRQPS